MYNSHILQEREGWGTLKALSPLGRLFAATLRERQRALAVGCRRGSVCGWSSHRVVFCSASMIRLNYRCARCKNPVSIISIFVIAQPREISGYRPFIQCFWWFSVEKITNCGFLAYSSGQKMTEKWLKPSFCLSWAIRSRSRLVDQV